MTNKDNGGPASDRELLTMAAKAAGIDLRWKLGFHQIVLPPSVPYFLVGGLDQHWNPIADDGDALRLAVKLGFTVEPGKCWHSPYGPAFGEDLLDGSMKATRRAIVRAAAAIGSAM